MVTLKQLAEQLNVSVSTVSKALNNSPEISKETILRVKELAEHLHYQPNKMALSLKSNKTHTIGVIIPNVLNHFFAKALYAIEMEASKQGYNIITCVSNEILSKEEDSLQLLSNGSVDGFIMSIAEETQIQSHTAHLESIMEQNIPLVLFDRVSDQIDCDKVIIDDFGAAFEATNHMINEGRKNIILISDIDRLSVGKLRTNGYLEALSQAGEQMHPPVVVSVAGDDDLERVVEDLFIAYPNVDGILSIDNTSGVVALQKALEKGYRVPSDLSVIGFSDDNVLPFTNPKLSTISQHTFDIGQAAVKLLINRFNGKSKNPVIKTIKTNLILRGTTK